ncbi:hypothetical protein F5884DRAFT_848631 [Xylogone sp. PMI_703]|nr:hypothetical protein F5884DRAFT_848631 [Xylogone sp. PMI_703]
MTAWMTNPKNTAIADFEFLTFPGIGEYPCQVAIANGYGNWIVPPTTINHGITKGTLLDQLMSVRSFQGKVRYFSATTVNTHYPGRRDEITGGMTYPEIMDLICKYINVSEALIALLCSVFGSGLLNFALNPSGR